MDLGPDESIPALAMNDYMGDDERWYYDEWHDAWMNDAIDAWWHDDYAWHDDYYGMQRNGTCKTTIHIMVKIMIPHIHLTRH
eukprot:5745966-Karenia_brevis.AAC.1